MGKSSIRSTFFVFILTTKCFGIPNHFESSIYSREKVWQSPNLFGSGIGPCISNQISYAQVGIARKS